MVNNGIDLVGIFLAEKTEGVKKWLSDYCELGKRLFMTLALLLSLLIFLLDFLTLFRLFFWWCFCFLDFVVEIRKNRTVLA